MMTNIQFLLDARLRLTVSEPWEFETENGFCSFDGVVSSLKNDSLLLNSDYEVNIGSHKYKMFICSPRLEKSSLEDIRSDSGLWCSITAIPGEKENSEDLFDLSWWRGGGTLLGTLSLI